MANSGLRMPIVADIVLHEQPDVMAARLDPAQLAQVLEQGARRFNTPIALPLMDLSLEKAFLGKALGIPEAEWATFHLHSLPDEATLAKAMETIAGPLPPLMQSAADALEVLGKNAQDLYVCGMAIGPLSLATKLVDDPIVSIAMAASGMSAEDDEDVELFECVLKLSMAVIERNLRAQLEKKPAAIFIAEPAANMVYISPNQMAQGSDIFERYAMSLNRRIRDFVEESGAQLFFHCCGELTDEMVKAFGDLRPVILSLGSPRKLWEIEHLVPKDVVLFGNLPSKKFFSEKEITVPQVEELARELLEKMKATNHPFILGSECDILCVPGCHDEIVKKIDAFIHVH